MIITLTEAKEFLRVEQDFTEEDNLITSLVTAAESYIYNATGITFDSTNTLAVLAVKILIANWYENRNAVVVGTITKEMEFSLRAIITQLQYCYDSGVVI